MAIWHGYILVKRREHGPLFTPAARQAVRATMAELALLHRRQPAERFQARESLDGEQAIYELTCDDVFLTPARAVGAVARRLGIPAATLAAGIEYTQFAPGDTWAASAAACRAYLSAHAADWEPDTGQEITP